MSYRRAIPYREKDDVKQEIIRKYLDKKEQIANSFKGDANYETYYTAVLYRMCCEIIRSGQRSWDHVSNREEVSYYLKDSLRNTETDIIIKNEKDFLLRILEMFDDETAKLILFLKCLFGMHIGQSDLEEYTDEYQELGLQDLLMKNFTSKQEVFSALAMTQKRVENNNAKPDAVRMWLHKRMDQIIVRLNGTHQQSFYDRQSLQVLFEYTFSKV